MLYSGSHSTNLVGNGNQAGIVSYGVDINAQPGDLLTKPPGSAPTRLNPSFGSIAYADNNRVGNYNGITFNLRGRGRGTFFDVSYTRSSSKDDAGNYPTAIDPHQFYGPSPWDVPNRFSATLTYLLPSMNEGHGVVGVLTDGWGVSVVDVQQSGYPMTVLTTASFTAGGDYNADGDNLDYPNVTSYDMNRSHEAYLNGVFSPGQFTAPTPGTNGNEKAQQFRQPGFSEVDLAAFKNTHLAGRLNVQIRFEFFNLFNYDNLYLGNDLSTGGFGKAISQQLPRWWQFGAKLTF